MAGRVRSGHHVDQGGLRVAVSLWSRIGLKLQTAGLFVLFVIRTPIMKLVDRIKWSKHEKDKEN